jgi:cytochrome c-type biogenesis protein CcmF
VYASLGHAASVAALIVAATGATLGPVVAWRQSPLGLRWLRALTLLFTFLMAGANGIMMTALLRHDFSVSYVAQVGSLSTPPLITAVSLWSSLEGSILFWGLILGLYLTGFIVVTRKAQGPLVSYALAVMFAIATFFALLIAGPANPFGTISPVPADGPGPNALLQNHPLMIIHPPMLYLGYVGMTVPFAVAIAALIRGELPVAWLKLLRQCMLVPWLFLSVGIILGSWWAYEVLGWGGFWAWDPVENASFLPWLAATGYLHSTAVQERKQIFKAWTLTLVCASFLLTILGTFMTRSGVFNSVHSFTQSPIGPVFLIFLAIVLLGSLFLLGGRSHLLEDEGRIEAVISKETAFLLNNVVFVVFIFTVLLGTLFPLITEALTETKLSVGEPYFDRMAGPLGLMLVALMGVGPGMPWGRPDRAALVRHFMLPLAVASVVALGCLGAGLREPMAIITFALVGFAAWVNAAELLGPGLTRAKARHQSPWRSVWKSITGNRRRAGGALVHLAILVIVAGITGAQTYRVSREASLAVGEQVTVGAYTLQYEGAVGRQEPHRFAAVAKVRVSQNGQVLGGMEPRLNFYPSQREPVGTPHVVTLGSTDLYISLLSVEPDGTRVVIKAYVIPMVSWLWRSLPLLVLGTLISLWPRKSAVISGAL